MTYWSVANVNDSYLLLEYVHELVNVLFFQLAEPLQNHEKMKKIKQMYITTNEIIEGKKGKRWTIVFILTWARSPKNFSYERCWEQQSTIILHNSG